MNQLYKLFNVKSDREYQKIMEQLDLTPYYMFKIEDIANNGQDLMEQRQSILSLLALTTGENYNFCTIYGNQAEDYGKNNLIEHQELKNLKKILILQINNH